MKEESGAVAGTKSLSYWTILLLLSVFLLYIAGDAGASITWLLSAGFLSLVGYYYRVNSFAKSSSQLLSTGLAVAPYDRKRQHTMLFISMGVTFIAFFAPLFLSSVLSFSVWFGSLIGIIDGWILGLLSYNLYLLFWQKRNGGKLYVVDEWNGSNLTGRGLSFTRAEQN